MQESTKESVFTQKTDTKKQLRDGKSMENDNVKMNGYKNKLNSVFRYLLIPFVIIGWAVTRFNMGSAFGKAAGAMGIIAVLGVGLIALIPLSGFIIQSVPGIVVAVIDVILAVLLIVGLTRGAIYAFNGVKYDDTVNSHFIDPIRVKTIITTLFIFIISGLSLFAFLKLLMYFHQR
jgi:hypothetical protein